MSVETYAEEWSYGRLAGRFRSIDYADSMSGYDWDQFHLLRGIDGSLYVGWDGGCSCQGFSDTDPDDLVKVASWQEAAEKAQEWARNTDVWEERREQRLSAAMAMIERLTQSRPSAHVDIDLRTWAS